MKFNEKDFIKYKDERGTEFGIIIRVDKEHSHIKWKVIYNDRNRFGYTTNRCGINNQHIQKTTKKEIYAWLI